MISQYKGIGVLATFLVAKVTHKSIDNFKFLDSLILTYALGGNEKVL